MSAPTDEQRRRWVRIRVAILCSLILVGAGLILNRAWELAMVHGPHLHALAMAQQERRIRLAPRRGTIYDRHGAELAVSVDVDSVFANPRQMRAAGIDPDDAAARLALVLDVDRERIARRLRLDRYFVWIDRQVTPAEADRTMALEIPGVDLTREAQRFYPNRELAAHLLGFANIDGVGIEGIELSLEETLRGTVEPVDALRDRRGRVVFSRTLLDGRSVQGDDVVLTIDKTVQHVAERELALAVRTAEAASGSVVVMDPRSGEILAMATYPTFNPNEPGRYPASIRRNRAVTDRFEPGSTVKPFTLGAAFAAGLLRPDQPIDCENGEMMVGEEDRIRDTHRFGVLTPAEVLAHSSNIGVAKVGQRLGPRRLYRAFRRFGFGQATGLPVPGETGGILRHPREWYELDLATISFGQGLSVTTVQLAGAMSAIANGGRLMEPQLVRRVLNARGEVAQEAVPRARRQVIPRDTALLIADMMTGVTGESGTGAEAAIDGYLVAGKTGTAQKADYVHGGYAEGRYIASFAGFVPAQAPRLTIAVVIDEPTINHYGGVVAGPVFRRVGEAALRHLGVPAQTGGEALLALSAQRQRAEMLAARADGDDADGSDPAEAQAAEPPPIVATPGPGEVLVPDLTGMTARRALTALTRVGLAAELSGSGLVNGQRPGPSSAAPQGSAVRVVLERPEPREEPPVPPEPPPGPTLAAVAPPAMDTAVR